MAATILLCGLVAVATVFSFAIRTNVSNRQMAVATSLLYEKMEELRSLTFSDAIWMNAAQTETLVIEGKAFVRVSRIGTNIPRTVTVVVYAGRDALTARQTEMVRATTLISPSF